MISRLTASLIVAVVVAVFAIGIWMAGDVPRTAWLRFYSMAVLGVMAVLAVWEHLLWRLPSIQKMPKVPRDIRGTWRGFLMSTWTGANGTQVPPKHAYLVARQTASTVSVVLLTDESGSESTLARVTTDSAFVSLDYMYLNEPDEHVRDRSKMHHGSASLVVSGSPATRIRGGYWTNRDTRGELDFTVRIPTLVEDYKDAVRAFETAALPK